jgi:hypothetical protein
MFYDTVRARPGSKWDNPYLMLLGVKIQNVGFEEMFGISDVEINNDIINQICLLDLSNRSSLQNIIKCNKNKDIVMFCKQIKNVIYNPRYMVDDLGKEILRLVNISSIDGLDVSGPTELSMTMCGETVHAKPDICIESDEYKILLVVQEDKSFEATRVAGPEGQLFAEMTAAFNNNAKFMNPQTIYGITLLGTYPTFYKVLFDLNILDSITSGYKRPNETVVVMKKYTLGHKSNTFMIESKENMLNVFKAFECIRLILSSSLADIEKLFI